MQKIPISILQPPTGTNGQVLKVVGGVITTATAAAAGDLALFYGIVGNGTMGTTGFYTVSVGSIIVDSHSGYNSGNYTWVCPTGQAGLYRCVFKFRIADGAPAPVSYGIGCHTSSADHADFGWNITNNKREGATNIRLISLAEGDALRPFYYWDYGSQFNYTAGSLVIERIR